jgi:hypothetical protein
VETQDEVTFDKSKIILAGDSAGLKRNSKKNKLEISCKNNSFLKL